LAQVKKIKVKLAKFDAEKRTVSGLLAVFGNKDLDGDIFDSSAFDEQLAGGSIKVPMLWQHNWWEPIGSGIVSKVEAGLHFEAKLTEGVQKANEALALAKDAVIDSFSVGFKLFERERDNARQANILKRAEVIEGSMVTFPANPLATISEVKSKGDVSQLKREMSDILREAGYSRKLVNAVMAGNIDDLCEADEDAAKALREAEQAQVRLIQKIDKHLKTFKDT
jgi:HK97 family phage prohead protease